MTGLAKHEGSTVGQIQADPPTIRRYAGRPESTAKVLRCGMLLYMDHESGKSRLQGKGSERNQRVMASIR